MTEDDQWKRRFLLFTLVRVSGLIVIGLGMAVAFTGLVHEGGWRQGGGLLIALGTVLLALGPLGLRRAWSDEK